jgi:sulfur-oxidizing protein SoxZ
MADEVQLYVTAPASANKGQIIEIKVMATHPMESGRRTDDYGRAIPRKIINSFTCKFNDREVFRAHFEPAIAANPYLSFFIRAAESGTFTLAWIDDDGNVYSTRRNLTVS